MARYMLRLTVLAVAALALAGGLAAMSLAPTRAQEEEYTVDVGDFWFGNSSFQGGVYETTIEAGETVTWDFGGASAPHTTTSDDGLWDSGTLNDGTSEQTFNEAGVFEYHCSIHPNQMKGRINVEAAKEEPTQPASESTPAASTTPSASGAPNTGYGPEVDDTSTSLWWFAGLLSVAGVVLGGVGVFAHRRSR